MSLEKRIEILEQKVEALISLVQKITMGGEATLNMTIEELLVNIQGLGTTTFDVNTSTTEGRILFCAIKDLKQKPFTWTEISNALDERGWHTSPGTLSPALSRLASTNKGLLIKEKSGYRLPSKIVFKGEEI